MSQTIQLPLLTMTPDLFAERLRADGQELVRTGLETLQLNVGKMCNLACHHCHVEAGPSRTEIMTWEVMDQVLGWLDRVGIAAGVRVVDLTGGAPEMNPEFKRLVTALRKRGIHVLDRCNLTILLEPGYEEMAEFLAEHQVEVVASLPCYLEDNVDAQRGSGVFEGSIDALKRLNEVGYGRDGSGLRLDLVYNPVGYGLPPSQEGLERDYKRELRERFGVEFNRLWTITNMPIKRFEHQLQRDGEYDAYMGKLTAAHNPGNLDSVMCRGLVSVGWTGTVYDCDFNQMLLMPLDRDRGSVAVHGEGEGMNRYAEEHHIEATGRKLWQFTPDELIGLRVETGAHCFGCTAGAGSSCTGSLG